MTLPVSDLEIATAYLRSVISDATDKHDAGEKMNAIKQLNALMGGDPDGKVPPGKMSRIDLERELERLKKLTR